jgi:hypothetical protein
LPKARRSLDPDTALTLYRSHLARVNEILTDHAQRAMAETGGKVRRAALILRERIKADAAFQTEVKGLDRYRKYVWPPMNVSWPPSENPKRCKRRSPKRRTRKS